MEGGLNTYAYVDNNPLNRTDPLGLWWAGDPKDIPDAKIQFPQGYVPPEPRYKSPLDELAKRNIQDWKEKWNQTPNSLKAVLSCGSLVLPPLGIPGLMDAAGDLYLDQSPENISNAAASACGVFCKGSKGALSSIPGIVNDIDNTIQDQK